MANYFTHFSFVIPLGAAAAGWLDQLDNLLAVGGPDEWPGDHEVFGSEFPWGLPTVEREAEGLWVHDDGGEADIETTLQFVRWVLGQPGSPDTVSFQWADTCSKPRLDAFSGGAALVGRNGYATIHTSSTTVDELLAGDLADLPNDDGTRGDG